MIKSATNSQESYKDLKSPTTPKYQKTINNPTMTQNSHSKSSLTLNRRNHVASSTKNVELSFENYEHHLGKLNFVSTPS